MGVWVCTPCISNKTKASSDVAYAARTVKARASRYEVRSIAAVLDPALHFSCWPWHVVCSVSLLRELALC